MGADGANSQIRRLGGFGSWGWGYGQEAVVCTVKVATRDAAQQAEGQYSTVLGRAFSDLFVALRVTSLYFIDVTLILLRFLFFFSDIPAVLPSSNRYCLAEISVFGQSTRPPPPLGRLQVAISRHQYEEMLAYISIQTN